MRAGLPRWIFVPAALGAIFIVLPLGAMASRVAWSDFFDLITSDSSLAALELSLRTSASWWSKSCRAVAASRPDSPYACERAT